MEKNVKSVEEIRKIAELQKLPYAEVSAKNGEAVDELFGLVVEKLGHLQAGQAEGK